MRLNILVQNNKLPLLTESEGKGGAGERHGGDGQQIEGREEEKP